MGLWFCLALCDLDFSQNSIYHLPFFTIIISSYTDKNIVKNPELNFCFKSYLYILLEKVMAPHSSTLAWKIPWAEEPGRLQSMGLLRVGHDWATSLSLSCIGEGDGNPLQCSCLENPRDGGAWWAAVYGVTQSWTRLKWLSSSSISICISWLGLL